MTSDLALTVDNTKNTAVQRKYKNTVFSPIKHKVGRGRGKFTSIQLANMRSKYQGGDRAKRQDQFEVFMETQLDAKK